VRIQGLTSSGTFRTAVFVVNRVIVIYKVKCHSEKILKVSKNQFCQSAVEENGAQGILKIEEIS
jgi:hypothetical protein